MTTRLLGNESTLKLMAALALGVSATLIVTAAYADSYFGRPPESSMTNALGRWMSREHGDVWLTSQGTDRIFILHGDGALIETVPLPSGAGPHITTFSPLGDFAYVSGMGNGDLFVFRADDRELIRTLDLGPVLTHQAKSSPDGSILFVTQIASSELIKVVVDEAAETWTVDGRLSLAGLGAAPICTVFRDDGERAYVSLRPSGIAIVDVPAMSLVGTLATDGFVACGMIKSKKGRMVTVASSGGGGHIYRLDTATDTLADAGTLGAPDWHSFAVGPNEKLGLGSSPNSDEIVVVDLTTRVLCHWQWCRPHRHLPIREQLTARNLGTIALDPTPGVGNDEPDALAIRGNTVFVSLRASGQLAIIKANRGTVSFVQLAEPAPFNDATCGPPGPPVPGAPGGCALHGVAVRP
jgi:sugar lactone lactonase YvrE